MTCCASAHRFKVQEKIKTGAKVVKNPALDSFDVICTFLQFVPEKQFLFFAPVSKAWRRGWGKRPAVTNWVTADTSRPARVKHGLGVAWKG